MVHFTCSILHTKQILQQSKLSIKGELVIENWRLMKCNVLLYSVVYSICEEGIGIELGKENKRMSDVASMNAVGLRFPNCGTVVRGPQVVLGFCPCGPLRLNISPKKTEKIKLM
jgi:hypothetical protein